ncbi:hypothetical protein SLEP1_g29174 [Rubroshorea leprosula]|uniref:Uncharacterized protein n=1 Tax=Rubroshorea leprosula TaxID=152421 RepID=A0AAV5JW13_9ROSI|nr:hypothetical protein SLEP1_g29174 [Rubroshorea leprosula]
MDFSFVSLIFLFFFPQLYKILISLLIFSLPIKANKLSHGVQHAYMCFNSLVMDSWPPILSCNCK